MIGDLARKLCASRHLLSRSAIFFGAPFSPPWCWPCICRGASGVAAGAGPVDFSRAFRASDDAFINSPGATVKDRDNPLLVRKSDGGFNYATTAEEEDRCQALSGHPKSIIEWSTIFNQ
jgi:hypothetical protein